MVDKAGCADAEIGVTMSNSAAAKAIMCFTFPIPVNL